MRKRLLSKAAACICCCTAVMLMTACEKKQVVLDPDVTEQNAVDFGDGGNLNYTMPEPGEEIVVMTIENYGDVKIRLFPDQSPKGVENFTTLVKEGYYDELIFHRVIDGFMIQGGDPKGNGTGGIDAWGSAVGFEQTISPRLNHVTGAVSYAIGQDKMNKSQFFIVTGEIPDAEYFSELNAMGYTFTPQIQSLYEAVGGAPHLDGGYEIFGQVFEGMEYVLDIQKVPTDATYNKPVDAVRIEKAVVTEYDGAAPHWLNAEGGEISESSAGLQDEG